jgi:DNA recombination-mediator protein A
VIAMGYDRVYTPQNADLQQEIARHGLLISQFLPGSRPTKISFPIRNAVMSERTFSDLERAHRMAGRVIRDPVRKVSADVGHLQDVDEKLRQLEGMASHDLRRLGHYALAMVAVEAAAARSGARMQVRLALQDGRQVFLMRRLLEIPTGRVNTRSGPALPW